MRTALTNYCGTDGEVRRQVELGFVRLKTWLGDARLLQELARHDPRVPGGLLKNADHVASQEVGEDEVTALVMGVVGVLCAGGKEGEFCLQLNISRNVMYTHTASVT